MYAHTIASPISSIRVERGIVIIVVATAAIATIVGAIILQAIMLCEPGMQLQLLKTVSSRIDHLLVLSRRSIVAVRQLINQSGSVVLQLLTVVGNEHVTTSVIWPTYSII